MSLLDYFRNSRKTSANVAKERLQIIVSHERSRRPQNNFNLDELQQKLIAVISDYLHIDKNKFTVELERDADRSILELNVTLPEEVQQVETV